MQPKLSDHENPEVRAWERLRQTFALLRARAGATGEAAVYLAEEKRAEGKLAGALAKSQREGEPAAAACAA